MVTLNSAYIEELYGDFLRDPDSVPADWRAYFSVNNPFAGNGSAAVQRAPVVAPPITEHVPQTEINRERTSAAAAPIAVQTQTASKQSSAPVPAYIPAATDTVEQMSGITAKIATNMMQSLTIPTATSFRVIPVKALEENRRLINKFLAGCRRPKISYTHIFAWAITRALVKYPNLNDTFAMINGQPARVRRESINIGLAVDTTRKDGSRMLVVPSIKNAQTLTFSEFCIAYDDLITRARTGKLTVDELTGASVSLTNPGTIGTVTSVPRLMEGQGLIMAVGAIEYPAEFQAVMPEILSTLAISKVVAVTSTYDHRIIQGAESGEFLAYIHKMILGEEKFYDQIFAQLQIHFDPARWATDKRLDPFGSQDELGKLDKEALVAQLIHAYRVRGHMIADVNPLGLQSWHFPELDPASYGFTIWDLDREFDTGGIGGVKRATLRDIIDMLRDVYCGKIGIEYAHILEPEKRQWILNKIEPNRFKVDLSREEKIHTYRHLLEAEAFEQYLHTKYIGSKRFSVEGGETTITFLEKTLELAAAEKLSGVTLGMAHRGRLNVLANILNKPYEKIFDEFEGNFGDESFQGSGDVKYHLGVRGVFVSRLHDKIEVNLAPNPSHLEAVNPVVEGIARAMNDAQGDATESQNLPILVHGDAAFAGQGVVAETLNMARLEGYKTGGTIHIVINNQIGFTTLPDDARSTPYATGIAKMLQVPILHVNGDDPEAVRACAMFAFEYRQVFGDDVVVDLLCYRKYGHNEADEPSYTQPLLYKKIRAMTPVRLKYRQQLIEEKIASAEELDGLGKEFRDELNEAFSDREIEDAKTHYRINDDSTIFTPVRTAVSAETLRMVAAKISTLPEGFHPNPKVVDVLHRRSVMLDSQTPAIDWAMGEALAFGTLLLEGKTVRMTGQDCGRGTFSHRHAVLRDYQNEETLVLLNKLSDTQAPFHIYNSPLSEEAVLGYEYGYSTINLEGLTLWEAQFGDFVNGAQVVIDQFISSGEEKWNTLSNLTMLLPHSYEGQGPEHSSARLERFLQLCAEDNMFVCYFTTPAQYYHALRRQVLAPYRKPLVVMSPKGYLRKPISVLSEFVDVPSFGEILDDASIAEPSKIDRLLFCSGNVYFDLAAERAKLGASNVAVIRVEQLYPFHERLAAEILAKYSNSRDIFWVQEEPKNMGAWSFIMPRLQPLLMVNQRFMYVGRKESASPAAGHIKKHEQEKAEFLHIAFSA